MHKIIKYCLHCSNLLLCTSSYGTNYKRLNYSDQINRPLTDSSSLITVAGRQHFPLCELIAFGNERNINAPI